MRAVDLLEETRSDFELLVVGSGELHSEIQSWAASRRAGIRIESFVQAQEVPDVLARADALVFPTHGDPYGLVVNEALAAGLPVVSSTSAGEIVQRLVEGPLGARGLLVETSNSVSLKKAMERMLLAGPEYKSFRTNAADYADMNLTVDQWVTSVRTWIAAA
jgi:glycosyltransferase involved in cell wall biosynthesis